jgi:hypothetical protein
MPTGKALVFACLLVMPGVLLRVAPYLSRLSLPPAASVTAAAPSEAPTGLQHISSRLAERPLALLAAGLAVEVATYVAAATVILRSAWLVSLLGAVPLAQQIARILLIVTLVAGFLAGSQASFPFVAWRMYSGIAEEPPSAYLFSAITRGGRSVRVDLGEVLPMLGVYRGYNLVTVHAPAADSPAGSDAALATAMRTAGRLYNLQHPGDPLVRLTMSRVTIPLDNRAPPWVRNQRVVASVEID